MKKFISKKLIKIIILILVFKDFFPLNLRIFSNGVNITYSQPNFFLKKNSINVNINNINSILEILRKYDVKNSPKKIINKDGSTTFFYRRLEDEPEKSLQEIKKLFENPPNMKKYQNFIRKALLALIDNNVRIQIKDLNNKDLSGQWVHKKRQIFINKNSLIEGSKYFAYLLSHEIIHVSQSCKGGGFGSYPVLLGLKKNESNKSFFKKLKKPIYKNLTINEIQLEIEAYSNQRNINNSLKTFKYFCLKQR